MNDKKMILILRIVIILIVLLIGLFLIVGFFDLTEKENTEIYSTTTRRTYSKKTSVTSDTTQDLDDDDNNESQDKNPSTIPSSKVTTKTSDGNKTQVTYTSSTKTSYSTSIRVTSTLPFIKDPGYKAATGPSKMSDAIDSWEWGIAEKINELRVKNGLNKLIVAEELRTIAETGASKLTMVSSDDAKSYLNSKMISNYVSISNVERTMEGLYTNTINSVSVATNKNLKYIGVGVLHNYDGYQAVYRYCVVFE